MNCEISRSRVDSSTCILHDGDVGADLATALYDDHVGPLAAPPLEQPGHEALHQGEAGGHDHGGVYLHPAPHNSTINHNLVYQDILCGQEI